MNNYINYDWLRNHNANMYSQNYMMPNNAQNNNLFNPNEGFLKGNLFKDLYSPYKNYQPAELTPRNEQEKSLYELSAVAFAAHELNLYLDLHPEDQSMFLLFSDYQEKANRLMEEYERKYGPLTINSEGMKSFNWASTNWPWEGRNV